MFDLGKDICAKPGQSSDSSGLLEGLFDSVPVGVFAVDGELRVIAANEAALKALDLPRHRVLGKRCCHVFRGTGCGDGCPLRQSMDSGEPIMNLRTRIKDSLGRPVPISLSTSVLKDQDGSAVGGVATFFDLNRGKNPEKALDSHRPFQEIVTGDPGMRQLFEVLPTISRSDSSVLVAGETGTGKNLLAKTIHKLSARVDHPFVTVNCAALPESLLESELFGYRAGAFTGAVRDKPGRFAAAQGGTLFLDEIGELPAAAQAKLLRVLEDAIVTRLGSHQGIKVDTRVVAATNRDLDAEAATGTFRQDLLFRLNTHIVTVPPLRERLSDVPILAVHFLGLVCEKFGVRARTLAPETLKRLQAHPWSRNNVRELRNVIERLVIAGTDDVITPDLLPKGIGDGTTEAVTTGLGGASMALPGGSLKDQKIAAERQIVLTALERNDWHITKTAAQLGLADHSSLLKVMRRHGLKK